MVLYVLNRRQFLVGVSAAVVAVKLPLPAPEPFRMTATEVLRRQALLQAQYAKMYSVLHMQWMHYWSTRIGDKQYEWAALTDFEEPEPVIVANAMAAFERARRRQLLAGSFKTEDAAS